MEEAGDNNAEEEYAGTPSMPKYASLFGGC